MDDAARWIAIEASGSRASIALAGKEVEWRGEFASGRHHNQEIYGSLQRALDWIDAAGGVLAGLLVGLGPGSHGGVRAALAVASGVALARDAAVAGRGSFESIDCGGDFTLLGDARRGRYFSIDVVQGVQGSPEIHDASGLEARLEATRGPILLHEGGAGFPAGPGERLTDCPVARPDASGLLANWLRLPLAQREGSLSPEPVYLHPPKITPAKPGHPLLRRR